MSFVWHELRGGIDLIFSGNAYLFGLTWTTIKIAVVSTTIALIVGLPLGLTLGVGRFRGRRTLQILANAGLALPSVVAGIFVLLLVLPRGALGSLRIEFTITSVYIVQAVLALPYIVALTPAAVQGLPPGLLAQARALGAGRVQLATLALREARIGVLVGVIAACAATVSEVGAVVIVGGNFQGHDQTLASALLAQLDVYGPPDAMNAAIVILLLALIVVLLGALSLLQQRGGGLNLRFRTS
jgi:tungstate transport system permease protein